MGHWTNIFLMVMPESLLGAALIGMFVASGFAYIIGAARAGKSLLITAVTTPFMIFIVGAVFNQLFATLPSELVTPIAYLIVVICWIAVGYSLVLAIFGQTAVDHAKGQLLYDLMKRVFHLVFSRSGLIGLSVLFVFIWANSMRSS